MRRGTERKLLFICLAVTFLLLWSMGADKGGGRVGPLLYVITSTTAGPMQSQQLTQLAQALRLVPKVQWFVVENSTSSSNDVKEILERSELPYTHLWVKSDSSIPFKQYNHAIRWLRELRTEKYIYEEDFDPKGLLLFADHSYLYDTRLFAQIRRASKIVSWPIGHRDSVMKIENSPWNNYGDLIRDWLPLKLSGFAIKIRFIFLRSKAEFPSDVDEISSVRSFLRQLAIMPEDIELVVTSNDNSQKDHPDFLVWES